MSLTEGAVSAWTRAGRCLMAQPVAVNAAVAVLCYLATIAVPARAAVPCGWPVFVAAAFASLPLVVRHRYPIAVAAVVGAGTVGLAAAGVLMAIPLPYGQVVATYTIASLAASPWRQLSVGATAAGTVIVVFAVLGRGPGSLAMAALPLAVAYALGTGARARRDRVAMLDERARRLAHAEETAAARERERIAREVHDIVAHSVSLMVVQAEAGLVVSTAAGPAARRFDVISTTGREAVAQLDRVLGVLRGDAAARHPQPGLDGLEELMRRARLAGLRAELSCRGRPRPVPTDLATTAYRLVQEAVTNTIRHAGAHELRVLVHWCDDMLRIEVTDDGKGTAADGPLPGHGLVGMRERVRAFDGELRAGRGEGGAGFRVTASLALPRPGVRHD
ncbi:sensor histidine kinase [Paractinoplanes brasiliensis]|uniref:histidine kinase n=1 Tax=Paractinoplanes brasiliensis TaxID=52695 RepID=A0A4R6JZH2_9ACTN|nr:sensor histidine kinase [Actinoplanes brasiliensis]TDO42284.1 signal transduction histidine kinase [Actinoplanes brasiliensis]GID29510.1 two-component sensor histidine kinase [Actinoplanes brasiliensis]